MTTAEALPNPPGEDASAGGAHRALKPDEAINQELLQAVLARFLSFTSQGKKVRWTDKALAQFKHRVKELTGRSWGGIYSWLPDQASLGAACA